MRMAWKEETPAGMGVPAGVGFRAWVGRLRACQDAGEAAYEGTLKEGARRSNNVKALGVFFGRRHGSVEIYGKRFNRERAPRQATALLNAEVFWRGLGFVAIAARLMATAALGCDAAGPPFAGALGASRVNRAVARFTKATPSAMPPVTAGGGACASFRG